MSELIQMRWNCGWLEYRQRKVKTIWVNSAGYDGEYVEVVADGWQEWQKVEVFREGL